MSERRRATSGCRENRLACRRGGRAGQPARPPAAAACGRTSDSGNPPPPDAQRSASSRPPRQAAVLAVARCVAAKSSTDLPGREPGPGCIPAPFKRAASRHWHRIPVPFNTFSRSRLFAYSRPARRLCHAPYRRLRSRHPVKPTITSRTSAAPIAPEPFPPRASGSISTSSQDKDPSFTYQASLRRPRQQSAARTADASLRIDPSHES